MKITAFILPIILFIVGCAEQTTNVVECQNPLIDSNAVVTCISIIDGDTWKFQLKNDIFSVRVLGIDTYETKNNARLKEQADNNGITTDSALTLGLRAKFVADSLLTNKDVTISRDFQESNFDTYNRLLRHCRINGLNYAEFIKQQGLNANE